MNCPRCAAPCGEADVFCRYCGTMLASKPKEKKGTLLVPWILLICMGLIGFILYFIQPLSPPENTTPWFTVENGVLSFDPTLYEGSAEITVPESIGGQTVTELSENCFRNVSGITAVHLPATLKVIGDSAFSDCDSLRGIAIPEGVTHIGDSAFLGCSALEAVTVPGTVIQIGAGAFHGCEKLHHIFFDGENRTWKALYSGHINLYTHVYCTDGDFLHR